MDDTAHSLMGKQTSALTQPQEDAMTVPQLLFFFSRWQWHWAMPLSGPCHCRHRTVVSVNPSRSNPHVGGLTGNCINNQMDGDSSVEAATSVGKTIKFIAGQCFGDQALLSKQPRPATVCVSDDDDAGLYRRFRASFGTRISCSRKKYFCP